MPSPIVWERTIAAGVDLQFFAPGVRTISLTRECRTSQLSVG